MKYLAIKLENLKIITFYSLIIIFHIKRLPYKLQPLFNFVYISNVNEFVKACKRKLLKSLPIMLHLVIFI